MALTTVASQEGAIHGQVQAALRGRRADVGGRVFEMALIGCLLLSLVVLGALITTVINDGASHAVDSSEMAFKTAGLMGFREAYNGAKPIILEPIMKVEVEAPVEFQGSVVGQVNQRRGVILETKSDDNVTVTAEVPLNSMFGYSTDLRSATQGKGQYTMEFAKYQPVPKQEQEEMVKKYREQLAKEAAARK